ncbi:MAG TPA: CTP synthase, partial [archaeon]|nr:CTP synthase [archaeon]
GEIDQDLGNYERFLDASLGKDNNLTTGKLYLSVIEKERKGEFLGKTVQPIPHLVDEVISRIETASKGFDFCVIEVGGTTGDLENAIYLEAMRRMKWVKGLQVAYAMVAHLPVISTIGEQKTKPAQHAVSSLRAAGILPDFFFARSRMPLDEVRKEKLVQQCGVPHSNIIDCPDLDSAYKVPLLFERQGLGEALLRFFSLPARESDLTGWREFVSRLDSSEDSVKIAIVGKYVEDGSTSSHEDVYLSVKEALVHAGASTGVKVSITSIPSTHFDPGKLREFDGILVPGGFGATGVEGKIAAARFARENNVPYLGICYGMQLAIVEIARSLCGFADAHTSEVDRETKHPVIDLLPEQKSVDRKGGTMRLGSYSAELKKDSLVHS